MAETLTYDPTPADQAEFTEEEKSSLEVGEKLSEQQSMTIAQLNHFDPKYFAETLVDDMILKAVQESKEKQIESMIENAKVNKLDQKM